MPVKVSISAVLDHQAGRYLHHFISFIWFVEAAIFR